MRVDSHPCMIAAAHTYFDIRMPHDDAPYIIAYDKFYRRVGKGRSQREPYSTFDDDDDDASTKI